MASILSGHETYLGDGLYASFDGYQIRLRAPHADGNVCVYLEPGTHAQFLKFSSDLAGEIRTIMNPPEPQAETTEKSIEEMDAEIAVLLGSKSEITSANANDASGDDLPF